ncbi:uncharacterized protein LOC121734294 [Aricia agestis]|uniref:uncharacterized protein LOC121734294 n=1 Tax=Aricia agestis TaxID=91739 RepID=UPI001C20272B|nr:uncharacterized protein LOC121734294 [Aricia agestis]
MSHFGDYMDGVPVKISEKYKRPPRIDLPYSVAECSIRAQNVVDGVQYCTIFEKNVLSKLKELKSAKETKKNERRHRLQLLEEAKQKKLDAIAAAEAEERLKQLSVSEVSYPSTDEISALSPDDKVEKTDETACPTEENSPDIENVGNTEKEYLCTSQESQLNILQPIQIRSNYQLNNLLDDPDPLQEYKMNVNMTKMPQARNVDMLTYKDFENDTSSPFDNVELKTINDMELLAQVLQSQRDTGNVQQTYIPEQYPSCSSQAQMGVTYVPNVYADPNMQGPNTMYTSPQHYPMTNGYYLPENICDNTLPIENVYVPNYQYFVPQPYTVPTPYYTNQVTSTSADIPNGSYIPQPFYYQYPPAVPYVQSTYPTQNTEQIESAPSVSSQNTVKSRSRSVPDIVKELNDELMSARQRASERASCNTSPGLIKQNNVPRSYSSSDKKERRKKKSETLPNPYDKFPAELQRVCQKIHGMGFPLDRVARVCSLVGDNDKRIIECLLILGELMDLGFSEGRVSTALAKHEFNKDKALDELVS